MIRRERDSSKRLFISIIANTNGRKLGQCGINVMTMFKEEDSGICRCEKVTTAWPERQPDT